MPGAIRDPADRRQSAATLDQAALLTPRSSGNALRRIFPGGGVSVHAMPGDAPRALDEPVRMRLLYPIGHGAVWIDCAAHRLRTASD